MIQSKSFLRVFCILSLSVGFWVSERTGSAAERKNIVLIAGVKSHGPEGNRIHDYPWSVRLLKTSLENSNIRDHVNVITFFDGWPKDESALKTADTIMIISDGRDGDKYAEAPHLESPDRVRFVSEQMKRGCGILTFHFSTFAPDQYAGQVLDWYGGYFDWETDGKQEWYSNITTIESEVAPAVAGHPVLNGVQPFTMREEFYFDIRFRENDLGWQPLLKVDELPDSKPNGDVVAWAVERSDGGRGFGTTCGHFYDNWKQDDFRKTILNAIAWTAGIDVPQGGVDSKFVTRPEIEAHLAGGAVLINEDIETADETVYAEDPEWYKPGHPLNPADAASIKTLPGFRADRILTVPTKYGSFTALCVDGHGGLLAAAQHKAGIYRITPPDIHAANAETRVEKLGGAAADIGWSHGLLAAFDSVYVTVAEPSETTGKGVYRLQDSNGDGQYDRREQLFQFDGGGEHGPHNIVVGPDGESLFMINGNGTPVPDRVAKRRPVVTDGIDHLMPPGFDSSEHTFGGWVMRFDPDGGNPELISGGLRNSFDLAFNSAGDLFTFDSDMEPDMGSPWYRPTRICHLVSGAEFGWRGDAAKWPAYFEDSVDSVVDIGPGSPTGVAFGYGARFPAKYQRAFFACDWTFATIHAVHLTAAGASYRAEVEEFVGGIGLPVTDVVIGKDGAMYFAVGGRRLGSAIYRVTYTGEEKVSPTDVKVERTLASEERRRLESFHGVVAADAIEAAWPKLANADRSIRFAARVAVESQPVEHWQERALAETDLETSLSALLALARQGEPEMQAPVINRLNAIDASALSVGQKLRLLRVYELAMARGEDWVERQHGVVGERLLDWFPDADPGVNRELSRLLCFTGQSTAIDRVLDLMEKDRGDRPMLGSGYFVRNPKYGKVVRGLFESPPMMERMHHAQMLLWLDEGWTGVQRTRYFESMADALANWRGGDHHRQAWERIREVALDRVPASDRESYMSIGAGTNTGIAEGLPVPEGPGREWSVEDALAATGGGLMGRDVGQGKRMFAAAGCALCHPFNGEGGSTGPDLSSVGQRFTVRDILEAIIHPSRAISDQYQMTTLVLSDGRTISGRVISRDASRTRIATNLMRPTQSVAVDNTSIRSTRAEPVSTMPSGLLNTLNQDELLDLIGYLVSVPE